MDSRAWRPRPWVSWTLATLLVLAFTGELYAHAELERSAPSSGAALTLPPTEIRLWFSEAPQLAFTRLSLLSASDSAPVALGAMRDGGERSVIVPIVGVMVPGRYIVKWRTGGADGHPSQGSFAFSVARTGSGASLVPPVGVADTGRPLTAAATDSQAAGSERSNALFGAASESPFLSSPRAFAAARWLELGALLALIGSVVMRIAVLGRARRSGVPGDEPGDRVRRMARVASVLLLVLYVVRLHAELRLMHGASAYDPELVRATLLETDWGRGWLFGIISVLVASAALAIARRSAAAWGIVLAAAVAAAFAPGLTGHAAALGGTIGVIVDGAHVFGAGVWIGTLMALVLAVFPALRAQRAPAGPLPYGTSVAIVVRSFSPIALAGAALMLVSGVASAWLRLGSVDALVASVYGRILLVKLALVALVAMLGAFNWRRMAPALGDDHAAGRIRRSAAAEVVVAALVLAVTAVLVGTSPPVEAAADDVPGMEIGR